MESLRHFCPECWEETTAGDSMCCRCSFRVEEFEALPYEPKLRLTLKHPIRENRMLAVQLLGERKSVLALPAFDTPLRDEENPHVVREVVARN